MEVCREAIAEAEVDPVDIASIGFSTQRAVAGPVDQNGTPVRPFISWQDTRSHEEVSEIRRWIDPDEYFRIVGNPLIPNFVVTKILWMRQNEPALYEKTCKHIK